MLRGVGFTKLYEEGRIKAVFGGEGTGDTPDIKAILESIHQLTREVNGWKQDVAGLKRKTNVLNRKVTKVEGNGGLEIFIKRLSGEMWTLEVQPFDTVKDVTEMIWKWEGEQPMVIFLNPPCPCKEALGVCKAGAL
jgi:hypothetical protein